MEMEPGYRLILVYKIAKNPIPDVKQGFEFVLVRRTLAAPDNWDKYGVEYSNFEAFPTYNYTTPHNIMKVTERTDVGTDHCASRCHMSVVDGDTINKELYLFAKDLLPWEENATASITVDGGLPSTWFN